LKLGVQVAVDIHTVVGKQDSTRSASLARVSSVAGGGSVPAFLRDREWQAPPGRRSPAEVEPPWFRVLSSAPRQQPRQNGVDAVYVTPSDDGLMLGVVRAADPATGTLPAALEALNAQSLAASRSHATAEASQAELAARSWSLRQSLDDDASPATPTLSAKAATTARKLPPSLMPKVAPVPPAGTKAPKRAAGRSAKAEKPPAKRSKVLEVSDVGEADEFPRPAPPPVAVQARSVEPEPSREPRLTVADLLALAEHFARPLGPAAVAPPPAPQWQPEPHNKVVHNTPFVVADDDDDDDDDPLALLGD
jgi:hypothetical protein